MPRNASHPSLRRHKHSSLGVVTLNGKDHYLGHWPEGKRRPPAEVQASYDALIAEWLANGRRLLDEAAPPLTVGALILQFWDRHAAKHYRHPDGTPTSELDDFRLSLRPLPEMYAAASDAPLLDDGLRRGGGTSRPARRPGAGAVPGR